MLGIFLDSETNGLNAEVHKLLEIAFQIVDLHTGDVKKVYQSVISQPHDFWVKSDPESLKINGFTWDEVLGGKPPKVVEQEIIQIFADYGIQRKKAVFICQNPSFDRVFFSQLIHPNTQEVLRLPYHWLDLASMHWAILIDAAKRKKGPMPWEVGLSKDMIAAFHNLPAENKPHRALNGVSHLLLCYKAVVGFL